MLQTRPGGWGGSSEVLPFVETAPEPPLPILLRRMNKMHFSLYQNTLREPEETMHRVYVWSLSVRLLGPSVGGDIRRRMAIPLQIQRRPDA